MASQLSIVHSRHITCMVFNPIGHRLHPPHTHTCTHTHVHAGTHTGTHTCIHTYIRKHTCTHTHFYTMPPQLSYSCRQIGPFLRRYINSQDKRTRTYTCTHTPTHTHTNPPSHTPTNTRLHIPTH